MTASCATIRFPPGERLNLLDGLFTPLFTNCTDGLADLRGRYIWVRIDIVILDEHPVSIDKIKLLLKSESMMDHLPEAYRAEDGENGFMTRFMSIFDSIFFDMDQRIAKARSSLDYRTARGEMLRYLAGWVTDETSAYLSDEQLREKIRSCSIGIPHDWHAAGAFRVDKPGVRRDPEYNRVFQRAEAGGGGRRPRGVPAVIRQRPYKFYILLPEKTFADTREANLFTERLKNRIPAYTEAEVVVLKRNVVLEQHTYLGVNSVLSGYVCAEADAGSITGDIILGGNNDEQQ